MAPVLRCSILMFICFIIILEETAVSSAYITIPLAAVVLKPAILGTLGLMGAAGVGLAIKKKLEKNDYSIGFTIETEGGKSKQYEYNNGGGYYANQGYDYGGSSYGSYGNSNGGGNEIFGKGYGVGNSGGHDGGYGGGYGGGIGGGYGGGHGGGYGGEHGGGYGGGHGGGYGGGNGGGYGTSKGGQNSGKGHGSKGKGSKEVMFYFRKNKNKGGYSHHNPDYGYAMPYQSHGYGNHDYGNNGYGNNGHGNNGYGNNGHGNNGYGNNGHGILISPAGPLSPKEHGVFNGDTPPGAAEFPGVFGPSPLEEATPHEPSHSSEDSFHPLTDSASSSSTPDTFSSSFFPMPESLSPSSFPMPESLSPSSFPMPDTFSPDSFSNSFSPSSSLPFPLPVLPLETGEPSPRFPPETDVDFDPQPKTSSKRKTLKEMMADFFPSRRKRETQEDFSSVEDSLSVEFLLMQALNDDVFNCAKMMLCGLGATPLQYLSEEEKATVLTVRSVNDVHFVLKFPLYQGMKFKSLKSCQLFYSECPTLLQDLLRSMRKEIARTKLKLKR